MSADNPRRKYAHPDSERIDAILDVIREQSRAFDISRGIDPDQPEKSIEELRAEAEAMKLKNDAALAELRRLRRDYLKLIQGGQGDV